MSIKVREFKHKDAFALMIYRCAACEHTEIIYNCRDGAAPVQTPCPICNPHARPSGNMLDHVAWDADCQVPDFQPPMGMGVWVGEPDKPILGCIE